VDASVPACRKRTLLGNQVIDRPHLSVGTGGMNFGDRAGQLMEKERRAPTAFQNVFTEQ